MAEFLKRLTEYIRSCWAWFSAPFVKPPIKLMPEKIIYRDKNLDIFACAIRDFEGYHIGSRSYRNCNPGNLKYTELTKELGAIGSDGVFAKWKTYEDGFNALKTFIKMASEDKLAAYKNCSVKSFIYTYSPPNDGNPSERYMNYIASKLGVPIDTLLRNII